MAGDTDDRLIILLPEDTVVARYGIVAGEGVMINAQVAGLAVVVSIGHKLALQGMEPEQKVLKYGVSIGSVTKTIAVSNHVHLHNMNSDYTATYVLGEPET